MGLYSHEWLTLLSFKVFNRLRNWSPNLQRSFIQIWLMDFIGENAYSKRDFFPVNPFSVKQNGGLLVQRTCKRLQYIFRQAPEISLEERSGFVVILTIHAEFFSYFDHLRRRKPRNRTDHLTRIRTIWYPLERSMQTFAKLGQGCYQRGQGIEPHNHSQPACVEHHHWRWFLPGTRAFERVQELLADYQASLNDNSFAPAQDVISEGHLLQLVSD